jgi:hypothetical protein
MFAWGSRVEEMPQSFNQAQFEREVRAAQRRAQQDLQRQVNAYNREVERVNRENQRRIDEHNRKVARHNQKVINDYNRDVARVNEHNRRVDARNSAVIAELARQLRSTSTQGPRYTVRERELADRVQSAATALDNREYDAFLSYARIDGAEVGDALRRELERLGAHGMVRRRRHPTRKEPGAPDGPRVACCPVWHRAPHAGVPHWTVLDGKGTRCTPA